MYHKELFSHTNKDYTRHFSLSLRIGRPYMSMWGLPFAGFVSLNGHTNIIAIYFLTIRLQLGWWPRNRKVYPNDVQT